MYVTTFKYHNRQVRRKEKKKALIELIENPMMFLMKARNQEELKMGVWQEGKHI